MVIVDDILRREGWPLFTDYPNDRGGPTKGGITLPTLALYLGRQATVDDLRGIDEKTARDLYDRLFVSPFAGILDGHLKGIIADCAVLHGIARTTRWLQHCLGLTEDGILGPVTLTAANAIDPVALGNKMIARRCRMIAADVEGNPNQLRDLRGWIGRAVEPLEVTG